MSSTGNATATLRKVVNMCQDNAKEADAMCEATEDDATAISYESEALAYATVVEFIRLEAPWLWKDGVA